MAPDTARQAEVSSEGCRALLVLFLYLLTFPYMQAYKHTSRFSHPSSLLHGLGKISIDYHCLFLRPTSCFTFRRVRTDKVQALVLRSVEFQFRYLVSFLVVTGKDDVVLWIDIRRAITDLS